MKCPKCGRPLKTIKLSSGSWYGHTYTFRQAMSSTFKMCDYSEAVINDAVRNKSKSQGKGERK